MATFDLNKKTGGLVWGVCLLLLLFLFASVAGADDKKKKEKENNSNAHSSNKRNSGSHSWGRNRGRDAGQNDQSQGSKQNLKNKEAKQREFDRASQRDNDERSARNDRNAFKSGEPEHVAETRDRNFADHDRGRNEFHGGPGQQHVVREAPRTIREYHGRQVAFDHGGRIREIHSRDMEIHRGLRGERTFVTQRNGVRFVSVGTRRGYMERSYMTYGNRVYVQRTYVVGGVTYARAYRTYYWRGAVYYNYAPAYYYHPGFYVWAYNPWPRPVAYRWGWFGDPWYPAYGYYFAPYPVYPTAAFWLTDFLIAENLRLSYENRQYQEAAAAQQYQPAPQDPQQNPDPQAADQVQLSPEVKQMIAEEVQRQLEAEKAASANQNQQAPPPNGPGAEEVPAALDPNHRVFVVSSNLDVVADNGSECTLTPGDVILRTSNNPDGSKVTVNVITSKQGDCASNTNTAVELNDLQEMQNKFREQLDSGMKHLADNQGQGGLPQAPDTGTVSGEVPAPTPDANAEKDLQAEQKVADGVEGSVKTARNPQEN